MKSTIALSTRIGVAVLVSLALITAAVTAFVVGNPRDALSRVTAPPFASSTPAPTSTPSGSAIDEQALAYARGVLAQSDASEASDWPERDLEDLLPNRLFSFGGSAAAPLDAAIVIGTVTSATEGSAFDLATGTALQSGDPAATMRVVVLAIDVAEGLGEVSGADSVLVGVRVNGVSDSKELLAGMASLGQVIVVLDAAGSFEFDRSIYSSRGGVRLLGSVGIDGVIDFSHSEAGFVGELTTVDTLIDASTRAAIIGTTSEGKVTGP